MIAWTLVLLPLVVGFATWAGGTRLTSERRRPVLASVGGVTLAVTAALAVGVALTETRAHADLGPGWQLTVEVTPLAGVVAVLVPTVALAVVVFAAYHEEVTGLARLIGGLVGFVGAMELLVVAGDLLTLLIGWELVGGFSYLLISHEWHDPTVPRRAAHAFNATRFGDLGLFAAAGAAMAGVGALDYGSIAMLSGWQLHLLVAGVVLAAVAKSAQGPFAPWLFSAMAGPSPVSALLHSATMVAAGAFLLARLHPVLDQASWFAPTVIAIGLATALVGGVVAVLQRHAKKLLAASTSAQYGLMLVAIGAAYPAAGGAHLVTHAVFKSLLFLVAGIAIAATGSAILGRHRLGSHLRVTALASLVGALALAAVPPLGAAWSKEELVAAAGHWAPWLAVLVALAGALSALYAAKFHLLAFGPTSGNVRLLEEPARPERGAIVSLAALSLGLGALFIPGSKTVVHDLLGGELPSGKPWELVLSLTHGAIGIWTAGVADRRDRLANLGATGWTAAVADWVALPAATKRLVVDPALRLASVSARFDDRVVDAGVRGAAAVGAWFSRFLSGPDQPDVSRPARRGGVESYVDRAVQALATATQRIADSSSRFTERIVDGIVEGTATGVGVAGRDSRRVQTGMVHHYYVLIAIGLGVLVVVAAVWR